MARSASWVSRTVTAAGTAPVPVAGTSSGAVCVPRCPDGPETATVHGPTGTWLNVVVYVLAPAPVRTTGWAAGPVAVVLVRLTRAPVRSVPFADVTVTCTWRVTSWSTRSTTMPCPGCTATVRVAPRPSTVVETV